MSNSNWSNGLLRQQRQRSLMQARMDSSHPKVSNCMLKQSEAKLVEQVTAQETWLTAWI